ncbi:coiled-coil domain-containing protein 55-domain containing protein [Radiomyces spectabilis]|uniref:coiled-coil domain-containing protein 55-domain containing protein n=1 Tax=Radiomyces spectabilis TaxID=64574 RepID=UPI00221F4B1D|nr:coiled-coil domain-containing protein 55-domain containing protein [Radiomyces spectabilis]KAI8388083.1 coiled-coil domain-containing protein 55-domain containing protein [Radiomyces spectabilis]
MKFGLNISAKKAKPMFQAKRSAFGQQDDSESEHEDIESSDARSKTKKKERQQVNQQLASLKTTNKKITEEHAKALEEDPNIFDYDAVYDDLKEVERKKKETLKGKEDKRPKYIQGLLEMAEIRKRDRLLAEEKKVAREREAEGEEFAGREVFMTEAFKKHKAELERIEAEEKKREEEMEKNKTMTSFYKRMLDKKEALHNALMDEMNKKESSSAEKQKKLEQGEKQLDEDLQLLEQARREGKSVTLNDNNEIVDKRELLGAGLNVAKPKFGSFGSLASSDERIRERQLEYEEYKRKKVAEYEARRRQGRGDERERLSQEVERQMLANKQKEEEEARKKQEEFEQKVAAKRTTDEAAMSAKERYLARKKQKMEETKGVSS